MKTNAGNPFYGARSLPFNRDELNQSHYHRANLHSDLIAALNNPRHVTRPIATTLICVWHFLDGAANPRSAFTIWQVVSM